ncbi:UTP--glucose-1-phosphate uridylyltransferase [Bacteriovorax sp. Seq25_V]|uniref:UTP--glucose-1-phosphate uridylyltransferase n=1 Tax=Bacteriovorax sp. Seq25_V TaxID=1201288 RepID=UPI00038A05ED|nr:UTP--glucose-1-phosphate uridylyltransferase [Bacteriovorax sp. Seq25_V]EQC43387.1 UTP--glucose-1-phosphate uridylyltransferase domain protein [Bacteriovorax sp. Seq25_V]
MTTIELIENPVERAYFAGLLKKRREEREFLSIHTSENPTGLYPTAIAPQNLLKSYPISTYEEIKAKYSSEGIVPATLWLKKMHGGIGSSVDRTEYLKKYNRTKLGSKGTDLYIETSKGPISIAEAQIIQASKKTTSFEKVILQDILNEEVTEIFDEIWSKHADLLNESFMRFTPLIQTNVPTLDEDNNITTERVAPAGHGLFGFEVLYSIFHKEYRPQEKNLICCIGNGEDLSSTPDRAVVNWMLRERVPICMVTTTKTKSDVKGGQIALYDRGEKGQYLTIIEKAQADECNQSELFKELGLRPTDSAAFFNTNLVLLNIDVLAELFSKCESEEELLQAIVPDLILNKKVQDGKNFFQLEGAMGSVFLNLDKYFRKKFNTPVVNIMNVSTKNRRRFFSPIKTMDDFLDQYFGKNSKFNEENFHLENI